MLVRFGIQNRPLWGTMGLLWMAQGGLWDTSGAPGPPWDHFRTQNESEPNKNDLKMMPTC